MSQMNHKHSEKTSFFTTTAYDDDEYETYDEDDSEDINSNDDDSEDNNKNERDDESDDESDDENDDENEEEGDTTPTPPSPYKFGIAPSNIQIIEEITELSI